LRNGNIRESLSSDCTQDQDNTLFQRRRSSTGKPVGIVDRGTSNPRLDQIANQAERLARKNGESFIAFHRRTFGLRWGIRTIAGWCKAIKDKKEELDKWNPDMNHPLVKCIQESKMAGLKETIKPNKWDQFISSWYGQSFRGTLCTSPCNSYTFDSGWKIYLTRLLMQS